LGDAPADAGEAMMYRAVQTGLRNSSPSCSYPLPLLAFELDGNRMDGMPPSRGRVRRGAEMSR
jgi:hypothetical protein